MPSAPNSTRASRACGAGSRPTRPSGPSSRWPETLPAEAELLRPEQRGFLRALGETASHGDAPATGEQWQAAIFATATDHGIDAKAAFNAIYLAFFGRANGPKAGWLLASLERDFVIARLAEAGAAGGDRTSVGVKRLRDEPDRIRQGAIDKREDPSLVDRAIEVDARRRKLQAESDALKAERNAVSKQVGEAIKAALARTDEVAAR
ncbi:MAG: hypothetical protein U0838_12835 [Chloroflexota bacterium]